MNRSSNSHPTAQGKNKQTLQTALHLRIDEDYPDHEDNEFFIRNRILRFEKMFAFCVYPKFHKYLNSTTNPEIKSFVEELRPQNGHHTRFVEQGNINLSNCHIKNSQQSFIFESIGILNKIPSEIRSINSANIFKNRLKKYLILIRL